MERLLILTLLSVVSFNEVSGQSWSISDIIPTGYNPLSAPNGTGTTFVNISATINSLVAVTESTSSYQLDITLKLKWVDSRLTVSSIQRPGNTSSQMRDILLDSSYVPKFWIPDVYFQNGLSVSIVNSGQNVQYLAIGINNNITYVRRLSGSFICKMDLTSYPQDYQYCSLEAVSLTKSRSQLQLLWEDIILATKENSKFRIRTTSLDNCTRTSYAGDFSCQKATLKLVRRLSYYWIRFYAPTFLCVVISFVGFWIPVLGYPARVTIIVTPILSLITTSISLNNDVNVEYVMAIYWWMIFCETFVYFTLLEYALAISWAHFTNEKKAAKPTDQNANQIPYIIGHYFGNSGWFHYSGRIVDKFLHFFFGNVDFTKDPLMRNKVDYCARVIFPFLWIIYVLIYVLSTTVPWSHNYN